MNRAILFGLSAAMLLTSPQEQQSDIMLVHSIDQSDRWNQQRMITVDQNNDGADDLTIYSWLKDPTMVTARRIPLKFSAIETSIHFLFIDTLHNDSTLINIKTIPTVDDAEAHLLITTQRIQGGRPTYPPPSEVLPLVAKRYGTILGNQLPASSAAIGLSDILQYLFPSPVAPTSRWQSEFAEKQYGIELRFSNPAPRHQRWQITYLLALTDTGDLLPCMSITIEERWNTMHIYGTFIQRWTTTNPKPIPRLPQVLITSLNYNQKLIYSAFKVVRIDALVKLAFDTWPKR